MMYMSKASHLAFLKQQRPPIWTEEAAGFHKRVRRIHDPVKIVVPCAVFEADSPFHLIEVCSSVLTLRYWMIITTELWLGLGCYAATGQRVCVVITQRSSMKLLREGCDLEMKSIRAQQKQHRSTPTGYHRTTHKKPASIDITTSPSIDTGRISEQKEFDVCGNLRDGDTTMRSDKCCQELQSAQQMLLKAICKGKMKKIRGRRVCTRIDDGCTTSIDRASLASVHHHLTVSIDRASRVLIAT
ncbi:hypothetical protein DY000_02040092 [Brassica cretica]|uniref:Uncharacterized protein n=1 Tax=Brassica cretica TaxID=69181 RepID=A0ABQ7BRH5_BRACR|nr:hypothetical protein DY000_02040092 [Brassica cretica]